MKIQTTRFGEVDVEDDQIVNMPEGIMGFEECKRYSLLDHSPESPFKWFQSVEDPGLAFVIVDPLLFVSDYQVDIPKVDLELLDIQNLSSVLLLAFVAIKRETSSVTANLQAPIAINLENLQGKQLVIPDSIYSPSHDISQPQVVESSSAG